MDDVWTWVSVIVGAVVIVGGIILISRPTKRDREIEARLDEVERRVAPPRAERDRPEPQAFRHDYGRATDHELPRPPAGKSRMLPEPEDLATRPMLPIPPSGRVTRPASGTRRPSSRRPGMARRSSDDATSNALFYGSDASDGGSYRHESGTGGTGGTSDSGGSSGGSSGGGGGGGE